MLKINRKLLIPSKCKKMKFSLSLFLIIICFGLLPASSPDFLDIRLEWEASGQTDRIPGFKGAFFPEEDPDLPYVLRSIPLSGPGKLRVSIDQLQLEPLADAGFRHREELNIPEQIQFFTSVEKDRGRWYGKIHFAPLLRRNGRLQKVVAIRLSLRQEGSPAVRPRSVLFKTESILREGDIYKMALTQAGVYKLSYDYLRDELGLDPAGIDPARLQLFSLPGGMLAELPGPDPLDDLEELAIYIEGADDGSFDPGDYVLFYSSGPDRWRFSAAEDRFIYEKNIYDDAQYVFLKTGSELGRRINTRPHRDNPGGETLTRFDDRQHLEEEKVNLLYFWGQTLGKAQGSGQTWYGDHFRNLRTYNYGDRFSFPNLVTSTSLRVRARMALRAEQRSRFRITIDGQQRQSSLASSVAALSGPNDNINNFAYEAILEGEFTATNPEPDIQVDYPFPQSSSDGSEAWLDYLTIEAERELIFTGDQMAFRSRASREMDRPVFEIDQLPAGAMIWDVTDPLGPVWQEFQEQGSRSRFGYNNPSGELREFIAFDPGAVQGVPQAIGRMDNQNLHALRDIDMLILCPEEFLEAAQSLATHRNAHSDLRVAVVEIGQVYNEFSAGRRSPAAIRNFARMLYSRDPAFRYLLLFGDGSFDQKDIYGLGNNFIPTYQRESFNPLFAFPADDYYGILEEGSQDPLRGRLNISVGRLPVRTAEEAQQAVRKIRHYDTHPRTFSDWRNRLLFVADDEDSSVHAIDADRIADNVGRAFSDFNIDKIYLDAFPQVSTPGGNRFPQVNRALNEAIFKGALIVTYLGHGGEEGWAQERILDISDVTDWDNYDNLTLLMTATCSFTSYDDPNFVSAGEEAFLNSRGGAVGLMTTVRAVYANQNARLTELALEKLFTREQGRVPTLGEAMRAAKNELTSGSITVNSRKFTLIGDPAQRLAVPEYRVQTTSIDQQALDTERRDTLRALQLVKIGGQVTDAAGAPLESFNGILYPTVFDKAVSLQTQGQDRSSRPIDYRIRKNVIFKGRATVRNGQFEFSFVVPKDINYDFGLGKISYYAADAQRGLDAGGDYGDIVIGGSNAGNISDQQGPRIELFMNSEDFVFGGITDPDPTLLVKLEDELGINVVGNSIGHDLEGVLDEDSQNAFLLNDFFQAELDDYTRGEVRFPLSDLEEGLHRIRVKAWDVANNSSEGYTEFLVAESEKLVLEHVLNYPNPFSSRTCFQFDHNYANQDLDVLVQIYTVSGRLVKTIQANIFSDGAIRQDDCIEWDGRDRFGDPLARGVYLYRVKVRAMIPGMDPVVGESDFRKLVLLK